MTNDKKYDRFTWQGGEGRISVGGKTGKYVNGKFVPEKKSSTNNTNKKKK